MAVGADDLIGFTRDCLARGIARSDVERVLLEAGWQQRQVRTALASFATTDFPVPVPAPRPALYFSAGEAFAYLVLFSALGVSAASLVTLTFRIIDQSFPDLQLAGYYASNANDQTRWSIARIVVAFPLFLLASNWVSNYVRADVTRSASPTRRWVTYAAMFINVCVLVGDLVTLVAYLLAGDATIPFLLKVATLAIVCGSILAAYLPGLRHDQRQV